MMMIPIPKFLSAGWWLAKGIQNLGLSANIPTKFWMWTDNWLFQTLVNVLVVVVVLMLGAGA